MYARPLAAALLLAALVGPATAGDRTFMVSIYFPGDGVVRAGDRHTSSGHTYDAKAMRCAHRTLPFGTRLILHRGSAFAAEVAINDRGPFVRGRELDCTPAVDSALHLDGLGAVTIESWPPLPRPRPQQQEAS